MDSLSIPPNAENEEKDTYCNLDENDWLLDPDTDDENHIFEEEQKELFPYDLWDEIGDDDGQDFDLEEKEE